MITRLSKLFGNEVFTLSGGRMGRVADVAIDVNTRSVSDVYVSNLDHGFQKMHGVEGKKGVMFPYGGVKSIKDIVLVSNMRPLIPEGEKETAVSEEEQVNI